MSMTRKRAIQILKMNEQEKWRSGITAEEEKEAFNMAIESLKEMSVEEYRQRLMDVFNRTDHSELLTYVVMPKDEEFKSLEYILRQYKYEPRPHGEWIRTGKENIFGGFEIECSICHTKLMVSPSRWEIGENFCDVCGSRNKEEGEQK